MFSIMMKLQKASYRCGAAFVLCCALPVVCAQASPVVNGLFFGDGDYLRYSLFNTSYGGSGLYYAIEGNTLYVALVVGREVNDNVFGDRTYTRDAGWQPAHTAKKLTDSEFAEFSLTVGNQSWTWRQGYAAQPGGTRNNTQATWFSSHLAGAGSGTPPPGYVSSSSFVWNLNTYATNTARAWNMNVNGFTADD